MRRLAGLGGRGTGISTGGTNGRPAHAGPNPGATTGYAVRYGPPDGPGTGYGPADEAGTGYGPADEAGTGYGPAGWAGTGYDPADWAGTADRTCGRPLLADGLPECVMIKIVRSGSASPAE
ncbi:hypothetical protein [Krasilnikovia sp. MM14-A1259]|uniref:hypothetical protein n=1 Tax=Krasilnikovia sp. MM14-A1259 TaxID=3373539 RepID=UPI0037FF9086